MARGIGSWGRNVDTPQSPADQIWSNLAISMAKSYIAGKCWENMEKYRRIIYKWRDVPKLRLVDIRDS
jgi:hypothetical protein